MTIPLVLIGQATSSKSRFTKLRRSLWKRLYYRDEQSGMSTSMHTLALTYILVRSAAKIVLEMTRHHLATLPISRRN